jgi:WhiB family redox-sensing transcriptional regulator
VSLVEWRHQAACRSADPELFFPISRTGAGLAQVEQAIRICQGCPVRVDCLTWALGRGMTHGVWGGLDEDQRQSMQRRSTQSRTSPDHRGRPPGRSAAPRPHSPISTPPDGPEIGS